MKISNHKTATHIVIPTDNQRVITILPVDDQLIKLLKEGREVVSTAATRVSSILMKCSVYPSIVELASDHVLMLWLEQHHKECFFIETSSEEIEELPLYNAVIDGANDLEVSEDEFSLMILIDSNNVAVFLSSDRVPICCFGNHTSTVV